MPIKNRFEALLRKSDVTAYPRTRVIAHLIRIFTVSHSRADSLLLLKPRADPGAIELFKPDLFCFWSISS